VADFNGDGIDDLVVGVPGEDLGATADARDGELGGLPAGPDAPLYFQSSDGVPGSAEAGDLFAAALAA
jgi:FG-GAP repeat protein